jgi:hypothetical protein
MARMVQRANASATPRWIVSCASLLCLALLQQAAWGHGSVSLDDDLCLIEVGFFRAHFKIYVPHSRQHEQFCEDLPVAGETVFVMEYVHSALDGVPIDFRIIRNPTGHGRFTRVGDIEKIANLDELTVFHHAAAAQPDVFMVLHDFQSAGDFVGVVTVRHPETQQVYSAVFPFKVGFTGFGYWPLFLLAALVLHLHYLYLNGRFARWTRAVLASALLAAPSGIMSDVQGVDAQGVVARAGAGELRISRSGEFQVRYAGDLQPPAINRIHGGVLHLETRTGEAVADARLTIAGGMPEHDHGLPTQPRVTGYLGDGNYRVEGLRYHMHGAWELVITIDAQGKRDTVVIPLQL